MANGYLGVDGTARKLKSLYVGVDGVARKVKKAYIGVDGKARLWYQAGVPLSTLAVGSIIKINESGSPVEFYVAKHDYESSLNGAGRTLLVRRYVYPTAMRWDSSKWSAVVPSEYEYTNFYQSDIYNWLNGAYKSYLPSAVQDALGKTEYPTTYAYVNWEWDDDDESYFSSGNTISARTSRSAVFLLSMNEFGYSGATVEGSTLSVASTLKIAYNVSGTACNQWTRSLSRTIGNVFYLTNKGKSSNTNWTTSSYYARPAFTLPGTILVDDNGNILT